jgi:SAM-dependent methyltransferase
MRTNYDTIAEFYDRNPIRRKDVDTDLLDWLTLPGATSPEDCIIADVGCGTGNQLAANRSRYPAMPMIGIDLSIGMLRKARSKEPSIAWVQGSGDCLPIASGSIDYLTNQFSYHHVADQAALFAEFFRVLKPGGRFVLTDIDPRRMTHRSFYGYFPESLDRDLKDFLPSETLCEHIEQAGFRTVSCCHENFEFETDLLSFRQIAEDRTACSQLTALSDDAHRQGLDRIDTDLKNTPAESQCFSSPFSTVKIIADRPDSRRSR